MKSPFRRLSILLAALQTVSILTGCGGGGATIDTKTLSKAPFSYIDSAREKEAALIAGELHSISFDSAAFFKLQVGDVFEVQLPGMGAVHVAIDSRSDQYGGAVSITGTVAEAPGAVVRLSGRGRAVSGAIRVGDTEWQVDSSVGGATLQNEKAAGFVDMPSPKVSSRIISNGHHSTSVKTGRPAGSIIGCRDQSIVTQVAKNTSQRAK